MIENESRVVTVGGSIPSLAISPITEFPLASRICCTSFPVVQINCFFCPEEQA